MGSRDKRRLVSIVLRIRQERPDIVDIERLIATRRVMVGGKIVLNANAVVERRLPLRIESETPLRGSVKLSAALAELDLRVQGKLAVDLGAAAGGFTRALLDAGARRVYAVDAGFGQLQGVLRQDPRVVCLERTNLGELGPELVPEAAELLTADLSYLALARAAPQIERLRIAENAELLALVKPMYELGLSAPPSSETALATAVELARRGIEAMPWKTVRIVPSSIRGAGGAIEFFLHARRTTVADSRPFRC